jgi:hypothetical protein
VKLDMMMLANYAEVREGLLYIMGGGWDTVTAHAPLQAPEGAPPPPPGVLAFVQGTLVVRLLFHPTETGREHTFAVSIIDEDGTEIAKVEGGMNVERKPGLPPTWDQNFNIVLPLTGIGLPHEGNYRINLLVDGQFVGDRPFRLLKGFS